jgi:hypothetical protein
MVTSARAGTGYVAERDHHQGGTLYIIAPVNTYGAREHVRFICSENIDLNRSFPGDPNGNTAEKVAAALMADIEEKQPEMVFDLHEARSTGERGDFLGSSLIYTTLDGISDMFMDMLFATQIGDLCSEAFSYNSPGPNGSINSTVANTLGIPVITVETFRGYELSRRMGDHLHYRVCFGKLWNSMTVLKWLLFAAAASFLLYLVIERVLAEAYRKKLKHVVQCKRNPRQVHRRPIDRRWTCRNESARFNADHRYFADGHRRFRGRNNTAPQGSCQHS